MYIWIANNVRVLRNVALDVCRMVVVHAAYTVRSQRRADNKLAQGDPGKPALRAHSTRETVAPQTTERFLVIDVPFCMITSKALFVLFNGCNENIMVGCSQT